MKKLLLTICLIGLTSCAQELTCKDFKTGKFHIPNNEELREYTISFKDSVMKYSPERDSIVSKYVVVRTENNQVEWENGVNNGTPSYEIIEWINDCSYRLYFDSSKKVVTPILLPKVLNTLICFMVSEDLIVTISIAGFG